MLEINILLYRGTINLKWIKSILDKRKDIIINVYLYKQKCNINDKRINVKLVPKNIKTYGGAYNYIIANANSKYFMLMDNLDYLDPDLFNKNISEAVLNQNYDMIKSNRFYMQEDNVFIDSFDDYSGSNIEIENKIMNRGIYPYFFGCRIYKTDFIKKNNIKFNDTDIYNDVYPNILLARSLNMSNILIIDSPFYIRYRLKWESLKYNESDLKEMIQSLININVSQEKILTRLADSYNYSINIRGCHNKYFLNVVEEFFDVDSFNKLVVERNKKAIYYKKIQKVKEQ